MNLLNGKDASAGWSLAPQVARSDDDFTLGVRRRSFADLGWGPGSCIRGDGPHRWYRVGGCGKPAARQARQRQRSDISRFRPGPQCDRRPGESWGKRRCFAHVRCERPAVRLRPHFERTFLPKAHDPFKRAGHCSVIRRQKEPARAGRRLGGKNVRFRAGTPQHYLRSPQFRAN